MSEVLSINSITFTLNGNTHQIVGVDNSLSNLNEVLLRTLIDYNKNTEAPVNIPVVTDSQKSLYIQSNFDNVLVVGSVGELTSDSVLSPSQEEIQAAMYDDSGNLRTVNGRPKYLTEAICRDELIYERKESHLLQKLQDAYESGKILPAGWRYFLHTGSLSVVHNEPDPELVFYNDMGEVVEDPESYEGQLYNEELEPVDLEGNIMEPEVPEEPIG